jgi:hypothetical protein
MAQAPNRPEPSTPAAAAQPASPPSDPVEKARQQTRRNADALARVQIGMAVEPAFAFEP